ncbi:MAG TPA: GntR family transcriptional regulator [Streptosporangiaceae bacterium]|jgi:GntR family transcriptional regulator
MAGNAGAGPTSLYRKVADDLRASISAGTYPPGTRLPSESDLAEQYSVSRGTVRQAFAALHADGVIASRRGARRVVLGGPRLQSFGELASFSRWAKAMGEEPSGRLVAMTRREAKPSEAGQLGLDSGAMIYHLTRVRLLSGRPVMIERTAFPDRVGALVAGIDTDRESIYERLEELGVVFADAEHVIDSVAATADDARLLDCRPRVPLLRQRRRTTDPSGVPLEWSEDRYLGNAVAFTVHNSVAANALSRLPSRPDA